MSCGIGTLFSPIDGVQHKGASAKPKLIRGPAGAAGGGRSGEGEQRVPGRERGPWATGCVAERAERQRHRRNQDRQYAYSGDETRGRQPSSPGRIATVSTISIGRVTVALIRWEASDLSKAPA
jgi:hypothetical protein